MERKQQQPPGVGCARLRTRHRGGGAAPAAALLCSAPPAPREEWQQEGIQTQRREWRCFDLGQFYPDMKTMTRFITMASNKWKLLPLSWLLKHSKLDTKTQAQMFYKDGFPPRGTEDWLTCHTRVAGEQIPETV